MAKTRYPGDEARLKLPKKSYKKGDLPETETEWEEYIKRTHTMGLSRRRRHELQWVLNIAYTKGYQNLLFDPRTGVIALSTDVQQPLTVNRIGAFVDARIAKRTKSRPVSRVIPNTNDPDDRLAAKHSDQALMHLWRKILMESQYDLLITIEEMTGTGFMKTCWNPRAGDKIYTEKKSPDGQDLMLTDDGEVDEDEIWEGEVSSTPLTPFAIVPANDRIVRMQDQPWIDEISHLTAGEIEEMYSKMRGRIKFQDDDETYTQYEKLAHRMGSSLFSNSGFMNGELADSLNSSIKVITRWIRPNYQYERGVVAVLIQGKLAMIDEWPNDYGLNIYPHVRFVHREDGMNFWGQATVERLIPVQRAYNRLRQAIDRNARLMAKGKWMLPKGAQVMEGALDDDSGEVVEYNPAVTEPHQANIMPLPNYIVQHQDQLITDFRDVGGQREASLAPGQNLTASVAMQTQAELSDEILIPVLRRQGESMELVANTQLEISNQEWLEPRKIKVLGEGNASGVMWLSKTDLKHHTDVHIEIESLFPDFRAAKKQTLMDFWDRRIITDPAKFLRIFRFGNFDLLLEEEERLEESVILDIEAIKNGKQPEIHPFQNHLMYVKKLSNFTQTPEFLRLEADRKQLLIQNLQQHLAMVMQSMPGGGAPMEQTNPASVGTPFGAQRPVGTE